MAVVYAPRSLTLSERLLLADLELAASRGYPPGWTVSHYRAHQIAQWTGFSVEASKLAYHAGLGGILAAIVGLLGAPFVLAVGIAAAATAYLESFERRGRQAVLSGYYR